MPSTPNPADIYAGSKLRLQRQIRNVSQSDLAQALGITFQQIRKYEKGINRITAGKLQMLATFLGVPVSYFFEGGDTPGTDLNVVQSEQEGFSPYLSSREGLALNQIFLRIKNSKKRRAIVELVKTLAEKN